LFSVTPYIRSFSVAVNGLVHQVNQQGYLGDPPLLRIVSPVDYDGDIFVVLSLLQVPHAEDRVLSVFLSIVPFQDDENTLSCYVLKLTRWHEALDVHLRDDFDRAVLVGYPKFS
jgi:hypothetical protein